MSDGIGSFLEDLAGRGHLELLGKVSGTVRFDVVDSPDPNHWFVTIDRGDVSVSHDVRDADCTIRAPSPLLNAVCRGEENAMAAVLRGALECTGDVDLLLAIQRLLPGPPRDAPKPAGSEPRHGQ